MIKQHFKKSEVIFPRFFRFFTEWGAFLKRIGKPKGLRFGLNVVAALIMATVLLLAIMAVSLKIEEEWINHNANLAKREQINQEIAFWQKIVLNYPNYRDGYFRISLLEYQLGNVAKAKNYLNKALEIDPNYVPARSFEQKLSRS